jgi:hypothetical protein
MLLMIGGLILWLAILVIFGPLTAIALALILILMAVASND